MFSLIAEKKNPDEQGRQVAAILQKILAVWLAAYAVVFLFGLYNHENKTMAVAAGGALLLLFPLWLVRRGRLLAGIWIIFLTTIMSLTLTATFGQGYRDYAVFGFPVLLVFAGMALNRTVYLVNIVLVLAAIAWLVFGEKYNLFVPVPFRSDATWASFVLLSLTIGLIAIGVDLLVKNMQSNLQRAQSEIRQRIAAEERLVELHAEKETLLRILSHDLANLLGGSREAVKLMAAEPAFFTGSRRLSLIGQVADSLSEACKIIELSRQFVAIESGKLQMTFVNCDLVKLMRETCSLFEKAGARKNVPIVLETPDVLLCSNVEPTIFKHTVLGNLIGNAIKFSYDGQSVHVRLIRTGETAVISVSNTGPQIPLEKQRDIFSVSIGTSTPGTHGERGTGFGLPLANKFVQLMHGSVFVESVPSETMNLMFVNTFRVVLSLDAPPAA